MFLWAWGINGCFSVIGAALVPIVATSFGLPAVVLVGAIAYLVALPAFFSVLMPLAVRGGQRSREAARAAAGGSADADGCARANDEAEAGQEAGGRGQAAAAARRPAAAEGGQDPARRLQRLGLPLSRHRFPAPRSRSSTRTTASGAATPRCKGDVCWEDTTYSDRRSLLYLPAGYNPQLPGLIVLFLHGQGATLERDVVARQGDPAADRRIGPEHRPGGAAARLRRRPIRAPAISGSPATSRPISTRRPSG